MRLPRWNKNRSNRSARPVVSTLDSRLLLSANVLTYHNDQFRDGADLQETTLTPANVNPATFGKVSYLPVDGKVDAQPLYVAKLAIPGHGTHNVLFVATENDSLYAFDADDAELLWHDGPSGTPTTLLPVGEIAVQPTDVFGSDQFGAELGILDTPVIDATTNTLYVVAESRSVVNGSIDVHQRIFAVNILTGQETATPHAIDQSFTYPGTNPVGNGKFVSFDPAQYKERSALTLSNGVVYTAWASNGDHPPYTGWVIGFRASNLSVATILNINPNGVTASPNVVGSSGGTFWNSGGGFAVDSSGFLYNASANGPFDAAQGDYGDSILKFSTANGLSVADYFSPYNQQQLSDVDADLGSSSVILLPDMKNAAGQTVHLAITAGKDGSIYLVNRDNLGQFNPISNHVVQVDQNALLSEEADSGAYFNGQVYFGANGQPLRAFAIANSNLSVVPISRTSASFSYPGTTPSISANGNTNGIVWAVENGTTAVLHAYDPNNLAHELYNSNQAAKGRDQFGLDSKFITPTIANGKVYVGTPNGVAVFGLLKPAPPVVQVPAFPSPNLLVGGYNLLGAVGTDAALGESALTYVWTTIAAPAGAPTPSFSSNGTNASKLVGVGIAQAGNYTFRVTIFDTVGQSVTSDVTVNVALPVPRIVIPAFSSPNPTVGGFDLLAVGALDEAFPPANLTYTWQPIGVPLGAFRPTFSANGTNATSLVGVRFAIPGTYTFRVTVSNPFGQFETSDLTIVVGPHS